MHHDNSTVHKHIIVAPTIFGQLSHQDSVYIWFITEKEIKYSNNTDASLKGLKDQHKTPLPRPKFAALSKLCTHELSLYPRGNLYRCWLVLEYLLKNDLLHL